ncbi:MAG: YaeQ family protein [Candidatus Thiodiazotropha sp. (ex Monitilora ramsayi)]|nr:YaeQ family protein [Candidatus Thiodiazotropha sp. (ex Monitilora ramsayi)]
MALKATIFKVGLQVSDMDRNHYEHHTLTLARHPSETDERMMIRIIAFALNADEQLSFSKGLSTDDEPDLWQKSLTDEIELWVELGQPDERRIRRACGRAKRVIIYTYADRSSAVWWQQNSADYSRFKNLNVIKLSSTDSSLLSELTQRNMSLSCSIQEEQIWISDDQRNITLTLEHWQ